ncbi:DUF1153 domain-containing protein [Propionispora vibrioides]|jgi:transposase-like protein|uniref:Transposase n=1 Tax=Propionispora vibrioides TaxID=112903 RepID=A0A1H8WVN1_9FIRM|nr:DUF1153 domain-containing protein [Propionispora vibrioides]SEP31691.1 Protein of unknown function [Propionispora vibrioides]
MFFSFEISFSARVECIAPSGTAHIIVYKGENKNGQETLENRRWTAKRRASLVFDIIRGTTTAAQVAHSYDLTIVEIEEWVSDAMAGMENQLRSKPKDAAQQ